MALLRPNLPRSPLGMKQLSTGYLSAASRQKQMLSLQPADQCSLVPIHHTLNLNIVKSESYYQIYRALSEKMSFLSL